MAAPTTKLLTSEELGTLTLKAPYVYTHCDQPYFMHEINQVAEVLQEQSFLNFFIRYRSKRKTSATAVLADASPSESEHRWSRVEKVVFLRSTATTASTPAPASMHSLLPSNGLSIDATTTASQQPLESAMEPASSAGCVQWRGKRVWIAFMVAGESHAVHPLQLSKDLPTAEEVAAFCYKQKQERPQELHYNTAKAAAAAPPTNRSASNSLAVLDDPLPSMEDLRSFLPTPQQISRLAAFRLQHITKHVWTQAEIEEALELKQRFSSAAAAAAPVVSAVNHLHNLRVEAQLSQKQRELQNDVTATAQETDNEMGGSQPTQGRRSDGPAPMARSPFLPRRLLRRYESPANGTSTVGLSQLSTSGYPTQQHHASQSEAVVQIPEEALEQWRRVHRQEESFFRYVSDANRSEYLSKVVGITQRNYEENKRNRLRGIENERRLESKGNMVESRGLWIADDAKRAEKASLYKGAMQGEEGAGAKKAGTVARDNASGAAADASERGEAVVEKSEEDILLERFKAKYASLQQLRAFATSANESLLSSVMKDSVLEQIGSSSDAPMATSRIPSTPNRLLRHSTAQRLALASQLIVQSSCAGATDANTFKRRRDD